MNIRITYKKTKKKKKSALVYREKNSAEICIEKKTLVKFTPDFYERENAPKKRKENSMNVLRKYSAILVIVTSWYL